MLIKSIQHEAISVSISILRRKGRLILKAEIVELIGSN